MSALPLPVPDGREKWFRFFWMFGVVLLTLNLGATLGLGNINWFERSVFLAAGLVFVWGKPLKGSVIVAVLIMLFFIVLSGFLTRYFGFEVERFVQALGAFCAILVYMAGTPTLYERRLILTSLAWLPVAVMVLSAPLILLNGGNFFKADHTGGQRLISLIIPAHLAAACYCAVLAAAFLARSRPLVYVPLFFVLVLIYLLTGTRMPAAAAILAGGAVLLLQLRFASSRLALLFYGGLLGVAMLLLFGEGIIKRFESGSLSGREIIWDAIWPWVQSYSDFGIGFGHQQEVMPLSAFKLTNTRAAHNEYLRILVELGYVGVVGFYAGFLLLLASVYPRISLPGYKPAYLMFCLSFLAYSATDNTLTVHFTLLALVVAMVGYTSQQQEVGRGQV